MAREPAANAGRGRGRASLERRSFLSGAGAALSAGLVSAALVAAPAGADESPQDTQEILTLQRRYGAALNEGRYGDIVELFADESQVHFNGGIFAGKQRGVRRLYVEHFGAHAAASGIPQLRGAEPALAPAPVHRRLLEAPAAREVIEVSADRSTATARFGCLMQVEAALALTGACASSLADMLRQQGQGMVRWWESGEFENTYVREAGVWKIQRIVYRAAESDQAQAPGGRAGRRPRDLAAFSKVYPQDPRGPDALVSQPVLIG